MASSQAEEALYLNMEFCVPLMVDLVDSPGEPPRMSKKEDPFSKNRIPRPQVVINSPPAEFSSNKIYAMLTDKTLLEF